MGQIQDTFSGKQLILSEIKRTCTRIAGRSIVSIIAAFEHIHIQDAQNVVDELRDSGAIRVSGSLVYLPN